MAYLRASAAFLAVFCLAPSGALSQGSGELSLTRALCAFPRVVGTPGYGRGIDLIEAELWNAGVRFESRTVTAVRAIPRRSEVHLFEDATAPHAFGGLRERWHPDAPRPMALPAAYSFNVDSADLRAPIVDVGAGLPDDFARLEQQRLRTQGSIALMTAPVVPGQRPASIHTLAVLASEAGCVGMLIAPEANDDGTRGAMVLGTDEAHRRLPIPAVPIRAVEADEIRSRLRARRVRGANGDVTTVRTGPGPVEARLVVECPAERIEGVPVLVVRPTTEAADQPALLIDAAESGGLVLGGAPTLEVVVDALTENAASERVRPLWIGAAPARPQRSYDRVPDLVAAAASGALEIPEDASRFGGSPMERTEVAVLGADGQHAPTGHWAGRLDYRSALPATLERDPLRALAPLNQEKSNWTRTAQRWMVHTLSRRVDSPVVAD